MKSKERTAPADGRVDYRWAADRDGGFEQSTFIYDAEGRLIAVDYATARQGRRDAPAPLTPGR